MNNKRKKILATVLIVIVILLGGAAVYIANQLSTRQAVAPNAPTSRPAAAENAPAPGRFRATIKTTPVDSSVGSWLDGTIDSSNNNLVTYSDFSVTTAGTYIFEAQYSNTELNASETTWIGGSACTLEATASATICTPSGVVTCTSDCPTDCGKGASTITSCTDSCGAAATKSCTATAACAATNNLSCNTACTTDEQCATGLICGDTSGKCRKSACVNETDCTCAVAATTAPTATVTRTTTQTTTQTVTETTTPTAMVTDVVIAVATPTVLPETGIFDLPGIAAFGGGLFLAVIGILLAL